MEFPNKLHFLLLTTVPNYLEEITGSRSLCMSYSWMVAQALRSFGIHASVRTVRFLAGNPQAMKLIYLLGFPKFVQLLRNRKFRAESGVWTIGCGFTESLADFHAVVRLKDSDQVLDGTIFQAARPQHDLNLPNFCSGRESFPDALFRLEKYSFKDHYGSLYDYAFTDKPQFAGYIATLPTFPSIMRWIMEEIAQLLGKSCPPHDSIVKKAVIANKDILFNKNSNIIKEGSASK